MTDLDAGTLRALQALCTADAEHPDASVQHRFQRAREILDSATPGDAEHLVPATLRALELLDEKSQLTDAALDVARSSGWEPPPSTTAQG